MSDLRHQARDTGQICGETDTQIVCDATDVGLRPAKIRVHAECSDETPLAQNIDLTTYSELLISVCLEYVEHFDAEVGLSLISTADMAELNEEHMAKAGPTDVLAFPIQGRFTYRDNGQHLSEQPWMIGDIAICAEVAQRNNQDLDYEIALLVVHGALHLFGYDHFDEAEKVVMFQRQDELLHTYWKGN